MADQELELIAGPPVASQQNNDTDLVAGPISGDNQSDLSASPPASSPANTPPQFKGMNISKEEFENMPISQVASLAGENLVPSAKQAYQGIAHAVTNPTETLGALKQIGSGLYSKAQGALGVQQDQDQKAKTEALVDALGEHYKDTYGSGWGGFKKAVATDPFSVGMDVSSVVPVVGAGARAAGLTAETTGALGKAASLAGQASTLMDPVQLALATGKGVVKGAGNVADWATTGTQSQLSGVPMKLLQAARDAASTPESAEAFKRFMSGQGDYSEIAQTAMNGVDELKKQATDEYLSNRDNLARSQNQLPMNNVLNKLQDLNDFVGYGSNSSRFPQHQALVQNVNDQIMKTIQDPSLTARTMLDLDNLKQSINDVAGSTSGPVQGKIGEVAKAIRDTIADPTIGGDPVYAKMMDGWSSWKKELQDYQKSLGLGNKTAQTIQVGRMLKASQGGPKESLLDSISATQSGKNLPFMLAGAATNPWVAQGMRAQFEYPLFGLSAIANPAIIPHLAGAAVASSPRISGATQYAVGAAKKALEPYTNAAGVATSAPSTLGLTRIGEQQQADGGRIERASGGRIIDHEAEADHLVRAAEMAKNKVNQSTEKLLNVPDEAIIKALDVAQQAI